MDERTGSGGSPAVGIIMGSNSDWKTMRPAAQVLYDLGVTFEIRVVSAHRTPRDLYKYADEAEERGLSLIIAGAGGAAHLPGMAASLTTLPVVGVPVESATPLKGIDALLSIMQMPPEVGVATMGVGPRGAERAGHFAAAALALQHRQSHPLPAPASQAMPSGGDALATHGTVAILAEDDADLATLDYAEQILEELGVGHEKLPVSSAVSSDEFACRVAELESRGSAVFIAGSARGLPFARQVAQAATCPVLAVPIVTKTITCVDEFLQPFLDMPPRMATFAVGRPGAINAALFAATIISKRGTEVRRRLHERRIDQVERVREMKIDDPLAGGTP